MSSSADAGRKASWTSTSRSVPDVTPDSASYCTHKERKAPADRPRLKE